MMNRRYDGIDKDDGPSYGMASVGGVVIVAVELSYFLHSLHRERTRPCTQSEPPPHSLHRERTRPCTQIEPPPHSLHVER